MVTEPQGCHWNFCKGWEAQASETLETTGGGGTFPIPLVCVLPAPEVGGSTELIGLHGWAGWSPQDPDPELVPRGSTPRCSQPPHRAALESPQDSVDEGKWCR